VRRPARALATAAATPPAATGAYLVGLLGAALHARRVPPPPPPPPGGEPRILVLIPAHDEAGGIADTLHSLRLSEYPRERLDVVVVADNCSDGTAEVAWAEGASVLERHDHERRGKGHALAWALDRLRDEPFDAVLFLDADCGVTPNLLAALGARHAAGSAAVQANYVVANPEASAAAGLRYAAFAQICTVRPLGKAHLGLSAGVLGTGMLLGRKLLDRVPWRAFSLAEDLEHHLRLIDAGELVAFAPEAAVLSPMPAGEDESASQQSRWESGRLQLARRWAPRLVRSGLRRRDPARVHAGLELLVPSQSALAAWNAAAAVGAALLGGRAARRLAAAGVVGQGVALVGALAAVRAPASAWRSLAGAPRLAARKLSLYRSIAAGEGPTSWERTARSSSSASASAGSTKTKSLT
jgi:1,2-diacylglycerol 3-beta-glucosyltransferase